jgi:streptogramin lyase
MYDVPADNGVNAGTYGITAGPDGFIWFTELNDNAVSKISPGTGKITTSSLPGEHVGPYGITVGTNGTLWLPVWKTDRLIHRRAHLFNKSQRRAERMPRLGRTQLLFTATHKNIIGKSKRNKGDNRVFADF